LTKFEKLLQKFINNPTSVHFRQIEKILITLGYEKIQAKGSHVRFRIKGAYLSISVPIHSGDCKARYKQIIQKAIINLLK